MDDDNISVTTDGILGGWIVRISWVPHGGGVSSIIFFGFILVGEAKLLLPVLGLRLFLYQVFWCVFHPGLSFFSFLARRSSYISNFCWGAMKIFGAGKTACMHMVSRTCHWYAAIAYVTFIE